MMYMQVFRLRVLGLGIGMGNAMSSVPNHYFLQMNIATILLASPKKNGMRKQYVLGVTQAR